MADSGYDWSATVIPRRASGYSGRPPNVRNAAPLDMQQPYAAGSLYSTTEDLLKWDQALYTDRLLPAAAKQTMWTPVKENYAYGWFDRTAVARDLRACTALRTPAGSTVSEHDHQAARHERHRDRVDQQRIGARRCQRRGARPPRDLLRAAVQRRRRRALSPKLIRRSTISTSASTSFRPDFIMTVTRQGNSLITQATGQQTIEIFPESEPRFFPKLMEATIVFEKDASGKVVALVLTQGGRDQRAKMRLGSGAGGWGLGAGGWGLGAGDGGNLF